MRLALSLIIAGGLASAAAAQPATGDATAYVAAAGASDLYERMSSELVLKDAGRADVRNFANMMITDHANTTRQVNAAATAAGLQPPPPKLMPRQQKMIDALTSASGAAREKLYVNQQLAAHQEALALHRGYAKNGDVAALKQTAATAVPIIEHHLTLVQRLAGNK